MLGGKTIGFMAAMAAAGACQFAHPADVEPPPVDAAPRGPLIEDNQAADLVIGQPDFVSGDKRPPFSARALFYVTLASGPDRLWAGDVDPLSRVLGFVPSPTLIDAQANLVLGRPSITDSAPITSVTAANMLGAVGVADTGAALFVVDQARNRVLIWSPIPTANGEPADLVLGQPGFTASGAGAGPDQMNLPVKVWSDGVRVAVSDAENNRVLIWTAMPTRNGQPADLVLGQSGFSVGSPPTTPGAAVLSSPGAITCDGERLFVADDYERVLVWTRFPTSNGQPADMVIGQPNFETAGSTLGDARRFSGVGGLAIVDGALFVADAGNQRVVLFDPIPTANVADVSRSSRVLGQANPGVIELFQPVSSTSVGSPRSLATDGDHLFVSDWTNHRVTRFRLRR